jgi:hypothetical protein
MTETPIDYDRLIADYNSGLVNKLRGFGAASEYLELWVPSEAPVESLCRMADAAATANRSELYVAVGPKTASEIDRAVLERGLSVFGTVSLDDRDDGGFTISVRGMSSGLARRSGDAPVVLESNDRVGTGGVSRLVPLARKVTDQPFATIGPAYVPAINAVGATPHKGLPEVDGSGRYASGTWGGRSLAVTLAGDDVPVICTAGFDGAKSELEEALLEAFCALIEGLPFQEVSDHGTLRLEQALRDSASTRPVSGVLSPEAADPAFVLPTGLIRAAMADFRMKSDYRKFDNSYDPGLTTEWRKLSSDQKLQKIRLCLAQTAQGLGGHFEDAQLVELEYDVRVVVRLAGALGAGDKQRHLFALERALKKDVEPRIELYLEELKDRNAIRRLSEKGNP